MDERIAALLDLAYRNVPAAEANSAIAEARQQAAEAGAAPARPLRDDHSSVPLSRSYELVLDPTTDWQRFASDTLPRLVYHLESVGARPPLCKGIVIAAFVGERLYFLQAADVVRHAAEAIGISVDELFRRHGTHESRTAVREAPLALPGGNPKQ
jgi:hypothetical protein